MLLSFTTSTDQGSVALIRLKDCKILAQTKWTRNQGQSEVLVSKINFILKKARKAPADLAFIAVDRGPGSFTGCRIGVNVAKTMAYSLKIPVVPFSSLDAIAGGVKNPAERIIALMDAHKSLAFCRAYIFQDGRAIPGSQEAALSLSDIEIKWGGNVTKVYGLCPAAFEDPLRKLGFDVHQAFPSATVIARAVAAEFLSATPPVVQSWSDVEPTYIRSPV